ncbi:MAG: hypothetical protein WBK51_14440 [Polaromonas sp.]
MPDTGLPCLQAKPNARNHFAAQAEIQAQTSTLLTFKIDKNAGTSSCQSNKVVIMASGHPLGAWATEGTSAAGFDGPGNGHENFTNFTINLGAGYARNDWPTG